ncbi:MAG: 16S rRNA (cytidine(1402)-2'-O)-methyltransferase [Bacteroidales bacterium]|nr:16S rRNA (cytidine(1402)-2'-O)-methyltransferase [Candidatus Colimorpha onthohippi]
MRLYLVPTPVGNLGDMTYRAVEILQTVDLILAEDTRTSRVLLQHYGIATPLQSYHIFNEHQQLQRYIDIILSGQTIALITDAGTPGISDPGFLLVREAIKNDIPVECLPGATAFVPALVDSGLPCDRFVFEGFLPHKKGRQTKIQSLSAEQRTMIIYESPHRLVKLLEQLIEAVGPDRQVSVSREISKLHAETMRGSLLEVRDYYASKDVKGEIVVVLAGAQSDTNNSTDTE